MSNALQPILKPLPAKPLVDLPIKITCYDRVAGMLISLLVLMGGVVGVMFIVWMTTELVFAPRPIEIVETIAGLGVNPVGSARDLEAPGDEMPELQQSQVTTALEAVTVAVSSVDASIDVFNTASVTTSHGKKKLGDDRPRGPEDDGDDIIPRWERWEVRYVNNSISAYAQQLDFFKIELGVAGGTPHVDYAADFGKSRPDTRRGASQDEKRLYMTWKSGPLQQFDQQLLGRANIATTGRIVMQFYPKEVEDRLAWIEMENANERGHPNVKEFLRTIFAVRTAGRGYEFYVVEQRFRPAPP